MVLKVFTDGGSRGNPGPAAIGYVAYLEGKEVFRGREDIGIATNNDAEYTAVISALKEIKTLFGEELRSPYRQKVTNNVTGKGLVTVTAEQISKIEIRTDSRLLANQVNGFFKVKKGKIKEYILAIRGLEQEIGIPILYIHVPREENEVADALVSNKLR